MRIHFICPVRGAKPEIMQFLEDEAHRLEAEGHTVHLPHRDVVQDDPTGGLNICLSHLESMKKADEVWVFWNPKSYGSHFDLGMAFALGKRVRFAAGWFVDNESKSYARVIEHMAEGRHIQGNTDV